MGTIKVRGVGTVEVRPDEAVVTFEVAAVAEAPADAFASATERARELDAVLDDAGVAPDRRSTLGIVLHEHHEVDATGQARRAHRAATTVNVRLAETDAIPPLLAAAVERADAYVRGPAWALADSGDATVEAGRRAVADASRRAEAYATALGCTVGQVQSVEEVPAGWSPYPGPVRAMAAAEGPPVHPADVTISAAVDVVYELNR
jgi:uncharacterized protein YggE